MRSILLGCLLALVPTAGVAAPCSTFHWIHPRDMIEPVVIVQARRAMEEGNTQEAKSLFQRYLAQHSEGLLAEGVRFVVASFPRPDDGTQGFLGIIDRLNEERTNLNESVYAPWALCHIAELYRQGGWLPEAQSSYEDFLATYPDDPLTGDVLWGAGLSFLDDHRYLEAALIFRRLVEEPKWHARHVEGALGLADATAQSGAWKQASYWYQVVEAERPELIRTSPPSLLAYGLVQRHLGHPQQAMATFLQTYNLYPNQEVAGRALNQIADQLLKDHRELLSLWFSQIAALTYPQKEPGRRGEAALLTWVVLFLQQDHDREEWKILSQRMEELDLSFPVSWDGVMEQARKLMRAPEGDIADEATFWMARGYEELGELKSSIRTYAALTTSSHVPAWGERARKKLINIVTQSLQEPYARQAWVEVLTFKHTYEKAIQIIMPNRSIMKMIAESYRGVGLPEQALQWYDSLLAHEPDPHLREDIAATKVLIANEMDNGELVKKFGGDYEWNYPNGRWKGQVSALLGQWADHEHQHLHAIEHLSRAIESTQEERGKQRLLRERAEASYAAGHREEAIKDYRRITKEQDGTLADRVALGDLLFEAERFKEAAAVYAQVADQSQAPEVHTWARFRLALSYQRLGRKERASQILQEIRQSNSPDQTGEETLRKAALAVLKELNTREVRDDGVKN